MFPKARDYNACSLKCIYNVIDHFHFMLDIMISYYLRNSLLTLVVAIHSADDNRKYCYSVYLMPEYGFQLNDTKLCLWYTIIFCMFLIGRWWWIWIGCIWRSVESVIFCMRSG
ncbi:hypothetical protein BDF20DRAFT_839887 [Mycotypha africana]|uniref:uncharacterized protein n=1 Tax=Mycotypha africana TaxID=64632 RepID=UPI002300A48F|nr:uncharacterized protein BDF20DRAFT_839887 [Mycotypha africana]KAI8967674.1 hypothetical protein BDF20DRAFT_839887 [Mycotypha africana]